jgi:hypothetical protein
MYFYQGSTKDMFFDMRYYMQNQDIASAKYTAESFPIRKTKLNELVVLHPSLISIYLKVTRPQTQSETARTQALQRLQDKIHKTPNIISLINQLINITTKSTKLTDQSIKICLHNTSDLGDNISIWFSVEANHSNLQRLDTAFQLVDIIRKIAKEELSQIETD